MINLNELNVSDIDRDNELNDVNKVVIITHHDLDERVFNRLSSSQLFK